MGTMKAWRSIRLPVPRKESSLWLPAIVRVSLIKRSSAYEIRFELCFFFQAEDGIRDYKVTGVQTCALPILALKVSDREIQKAILNVAKRDGLMVEPSSAAAFAAVPQLYATGGIDTNDSVVVIATGSGLKTLEQFYRHETR